MEYVRGDVCGVDNCRATQYYIEDGLWFCRNGHRREGRVQVLEDDDAFGTQGKRSRKKVEGREKFARILHGSRGLELFLQCYQLILWKQVHWLVQDSGFPPEYEVVVRDLWALRLQSMKRKLTDTSDTEAQQSVYTSTSEEESASASGKNPDGKPKRRWAGKDEPKLLDTLGICYLGALLLRIPYSIGDFHKWADNESIVYIRAIRFVPKEMLSRLPAKSHGSLDTRTALVPDQLQKAVQELVLFYHGEYGMSFPALNHPLLWFKYIKELALPLDVYLAAKTLTAMLGYTYIHKYRASRYRVIDIPEVQLMSTIIVSLKLAWSFDSMERNPKSEFESASLATNWEAWSKFIEEHNAPPHSLYDGKEIHVVEGDVFNMSKNQMDQYMDWYEKMWVDNETEPKLPKHLLDFFPTTRAGAGLPEKAPQRDGSISGFKDGDLIATIRRVQGSLRPQKPVPEAADVGNEQNRENAIARPGTKYKVYRHVSELPQAAFPLYKAAAEAIAVSVKTLVAGVAQVEWKLQLWAEAESGRIDAAQTEEEEEEEEVESLESEYDT